MYYKKASQKFARNIDWASHAAAVFVMGGVFFPRGDAWNVIFGALLWLSMQVSAFFLRAWSDGMPDKPP